MSNEIEEMVKPITRILLAFLSLVSALTFLAGVMLYFFNIYALSVFFIVWWASTALIEEIESKGERLLISLAVPASLGVLGFAFLELALM